MLIRKLLILLAFLFFNDPAWSQEDITVLTDRFSELFKAGNFIDAQKCLLEMLDESYKDPVRYKTYIYANLGATSTLLGRYEDALNYYSIAEKSIYDKRDSDFYLTDIYIHKAIIYGYQKDYPAAVDYYEKGIRNYTSIRNPDSRIMYNLSVTYLDYGIVLLNTGKTDASLLYLEKCRDLSLRFNFEGTPYADLNIAKIYVKRAEFARAEKSFREAIVSLTNEYGQDFYKLPEIYFEYGQFLYNSGKYDESLQILKKANEICLKTYGEKHSLSSYSYKLLGDYYLKQQDYPSALKYFQNSLISIVNNFNDPDIFANPGNKGSLFDIRLLDNLKSKAKALELMASGEPDTLSEIKLLSAGLDVIDSAIVLIEKMRWAYPDNESRLYLSENEKETCLSGTRIAGKLLSATGNNRMVERMYFMARNAKASGLRNEIMGNNVFWSTAIPDSVRAKQNSLAVSIGAYENLVREESLKPYPDSNKISLWKDALFRMNREYEQVAGAIRKDYPKYSELLEKTGSMTVSEIRRRMKKHETIIDYFFSRHDAGGKRNLYIFLISRYNINVYESIIDSAFQKNAKIIIKMNSDARDQFTRAEEYKNALYYMYEALLKPVENKFSGNRLIIVPDEEISRLPFEAFLTAKPETGSTGYQNLEYLIRKYAVSYGYSSSLVFANKTRKGRRVAAFLPDYSAPGNDVSEFAGLRGAGEETESIFRWFRGTTYAGTQASKENFIKILADESVLHLAMHSVSDSVTSQYSYLQFDAHDIPEKDARLYNYEISLARIKSPMVVLSACNSGEGELFHGEGLMSIARGFMLAGSSSVIRTSWAVNDESGAAVMKRFYHYLSAGKSKNVAMRLARLNYLKSTIPAYSCPYYWAAYEILGDNSPVAVNTTFRIIVYTLIIMVIAGFLLYYLRRRRIFPALLL